MPLQVVKTEQQINLIILEHRQGNLNCLPASQELHIGQVDTAEDFRLTYTDSHTCKSRVQLVEQVALLSALFADDRALGTTIDKSLNRLPIDLGVDVEHGNVAKELRVILHCGLVIRTNHLLSNLLFYQLLCLYVIRVRIAHLHLTLLLGLLLRHDFFEPLGHKLFDLLVVC